MSGCAEHDATMRPDGLASQGRRRGRSALLLALLVLLIGATVLVAVLHLVPSVGAAGGCGGG